MELVDLFLSDVLRNNRLCRVFGYRPRYPAFVWISGFRWVFLLKGPPYLMEEFLSDL